MSLTSFVPAAVPSDFQSSARPYALRALKKSVWLALVRYHGWLPPRPRLTSLTSLVPGPVPSDFQSSLPYPAPRALKKVLPWNLVNPQGSLLFGVPPAVTPGLMSLTSFVPAAVPSDFQGSSPCRPSLAGKMRARLIFTKERQFDELPS